MALVFQLVPDCSTVEDAKAGGGTWQIPGGRLADPKDSKVQRGHYSTVLRTSCGTLRIEPHPAAMSWTTLMLIDPKDVNNLKAVMQNMTLHGAPITALKTDSGSVSAASKAMIGQVGKPYELTAAGILTIG